MPGLRMLEKYAVLLGGGGQSSLRLDDGVFIKAITWRWREELEPWSNPTREKIGTAQS